MVDGVEKSRRVKSNLTEDVRLVGWQYWCSLAGEPVFEVDAWVGGSIRITVVVTRSGRRWMDVFCKPSFSSFGLSI